MGIEAWMLNLGKYCANLLREISQYRELTEKEKIFLEDMESLEGDDSYE